jgi:hypothetical protein
MTRRRWRPGLRLTGGSAGSIGSFPGSTEICITDFCSAASPRAVRIERAGSALGYAYTSAEAHVGPRAIAPDADAKAVVTTARRCALESQPRYVSMIVPGTGGNWSNYLPRTPGFL